MQSSFWIVFNNTRFNVINTAKQLKNKSLSIKSLPKVHVWRDKKGIIWTLNHRRIAAIILAGNIKKIPVIWATVKEVMQHKFHYTTKNKGTSFIGFLTHRLGIVIGQKKTSNQSLTKNIKKSSDS